MVFFLQGPRQSGKTTLLRDVLLPYAESLGGMMVQRLVERGRVRGFRALVLEGGALPSAQAPFEEGLSGVFLQDGHTVPLVLEEVLEKAGRRCQEESCRLVFLDEIGGIELASPRFMAALAEIFALQKPCVGVVKSRENLAGTLQRLGLPKTLAEQRDALQAKLEESGRVLYMTQQNAAEIRLLLQAFLKEHRVAP